MLQRVRFVPLQGTLADFHLYVLLAPHLANAGAGNTAWVGDYKGSPMLFAEREHHALALASSAPWLARSVGFVGVSDGWQELHANKRLDHTYARAENGNVAVTGEIDLVVVRWNVRDGARIRADRDGGRSTRAHHAFSRTSTKRTRSTFAHGEPGTRGSWTASRRSSERASIRSAPRCCGHTNRSAWRAGSSRASPIPWGFSKPDDDLGGYHLVWPRDLVEIAGGFVAIGAHEHVRRVLRYLQVTQEPDGHWSQNMWLDGRPYWHGVQMDETALPILLVDLAAREGVIDTAGRDALWPMVRRAAVFLARNGPVSPQDRWEEQPGYAPFTVAHRDRGAPRRGRSRRRGVEHDRGRSICGRPPTHGTPASSDGYTWRGPNSRNCTASRGITSVSRSPITPMRRRRVRGLSRSRTGPRIEATGPAALMVSLDALAFVRFGLRAPDDPRILSTVKVIDATLKVETPRGPAWHRYQGDGYGEHADGGPYDGTGVGRAWPLLTGERAHYELAAGRLHVAEHLAQAMETMAGEAGLLPEQIWDSADIPDRELYIGHASGSAMPLVWAHAEYLKLCRSLFDGHIFDQPPQTVERYLVQQTTSDRIVWRFNNKVRAMPANRTLRVETLAPAVVHWSVDGWRTVHDTATRDTTLGVHVCRPWDQGPAPWRPRPSHVLLARSGAMGRGRLSGVHRMTSAAVRRLPC